jgi:hypothetical protein
LKGVKYLDLVAVLNFMYHGEVNVAQEELNSFLAVAEDLRVKGLTQGGGAEKKSGNSSRNSPPPSSSAPPAASQAGGGGVSQKQVRQRDQQSDRGGETVGAAPTAKRQRVAPPIVSSTPSNSKVRKMIR